MSDVLIDPPFKTSKDYLLVSRIGRKSLHMRWLATADDRNFDVFLSCYDVTVPVTAGEGIRFEYRPGKKVAGYAGFMKEYASLLRDYKYICFFDEDIDVDAATIAGAFDLCRQHNLKIAQPALTWDSHFTFAALLQQPGFDLRYINYVEMMCPFFRQDILERVAPLYSLGFESGIDLVWCNLVSESPRDCAVIDRFPVRHTEPVGGNKAANGFVGGRIYEDDIYAVLKMFKLPWLRTVPFGGIEHSGRQTTSRLQLFLTAIPLLGAISQQKPFRWRLRAVMVYLYHLLLGPAANIKVSLPGHSQRGPTLPPRPTPLRRIETVANSAFGGSSPRPPATSR
ncbi:hypothetical protein LMIY3S_01912 [Labrys miyagiensis]